MTVTNWSVYVNQLAVTDLDRIFAARRMFEPTWMRRIRKTSKIYRKWWQGNQRRAIATTVFWRAEGTWKNVTDHVGMFIQLIIQNGYRHTHTHTRARWFIITSKTYIRAPINFKQVVQYPVFVEWVWPSLKLIWWVGQFPLSNCPSLGYLWPIKQTHHWATEVWFLQMGQLLSPYDVTATWPPSLWQTAIQKRTKRAGGGVERSGISWPSKPHLTHVQFHGPYVSCTLLHICSHMQIEIKATSQWPPSKWSLVRIPRVSLLLNWDLITKICPDLCVVQTMNWTEDGHWGS